MDQLSLHLIRIHYGPYLVEDAKRTQKDKQHEAPKNENVAPVYPFDHEGKTLDITLF